MVYFQANFLSLNKGIDKTNKKTSSCFCPIIRSLLPENYNEGLIEFCLYIASFCLWLVGFFVLVCFVFKVE